MQLRHVAGLAPDSSFIPRATLGFTLQEAFPFLATGWALLWTALSMSDGGFHQGAQEAGLLFLVPTLGWLLGWLRANAQAPLSLDTRMDLVRSALGLVPVVIIGTLPAVGEHVRHLPPGAAHKDPAAAVLKAVSFWLPWLLIFASRAWTGRTETAAETRRAPAPPPALPRPPSPSVMVPVGDRLRPLAWESVLWLEADDNYVRLHTAGADYFVRRSLRELLTEAGERFARIHKSRAVNLAEVAAIRPLGNGDGEVRLRAGQKLRMSRRFRHDLAALLKL